MRTTLREEILIHAVADLVAQSCTVSGDTGELDSHGISTYSDALELLADYGRVVIELRAGDRVFASWLRRVSP